MFIVYNNEKLVIELIAWRLDYKSPLNSGSDLWLLGYPLALEQKGLCCARPPHTLKLGGHWPCISAHPSQNKLSIIPRLRAREFLEFQGARANWPVVSARAAEGGACVFRTLSKFNLWERSAHATPFVLLCTYSRPIVRAPPNMFNWTFSKENFSTNWKWNPSRVWSII
jgi:hypothetical protein